LINFYIVATPIGNYEDITLRALKILNDADFIVCEEEKEYKKLFGILKLKEKKFILCNEHNEQEAVELVLPLLKNREIGALISDCGTPLFEDPGFYLIKAIRQQGYQITALPGANSLITALSLSPFKINNFYYTGFLPRETLEREKKLLTLLKRNEPLIIIEAPYRLKNLLTLIKEKGKTRQVYLALNLTMTDETLIWGRAEDIEKHVNEKNIKKGEFLIIII
jgi:16S rRNA (cytidine1402-2'-O)-methyltransferase